MQTIDAGANKKWWRVSIPIEIVWQLNFYFFIYVTSIPVLLFDWTVKKYNQIGRILIENLIVMKWNSMKFLAGTFYFSKFMLIIKTLGVLGV